MKGSREATPWGSWRSNWYEQLLPDFRAGGVRRRDYLWTFAGKDLLIAMENGLRDLDIFTVDSLGRLISTKTKFCKEEESSREN